ncbi:tripartite tricarboxylate transporter substrate binding protein [Ramlibacter sp. USB13]|uniref:Tripartite tricarboxylate transporter substrate binding protein n=1 Tax=Ramlibacter cellulosilyticus TaxID=2764187 RepID=A0A923MM14_9BURK|nr:tripartite tricarboxylate transporter substrate binding protein [Ramlibacter cellulosilyticus]MBC5781500.1 tripartite tricarboxylate transporter substrate binding protein [Ramlibacter cellulosilyticus]
MITRRHFLGASAALPVLAGAPAFAQPGFPDKPVKIIVPLPPGSPPDVLARVAGEGLGKLWKQPVIVENRPGATGMIGMQAVARAAPDGHTVGVLFLTHTVLPSLMGPLPYDTSRDLAPIGNLVWLYNVLVVPAASPVQTLQQLLEGARKQPEALTYASGGNGSPAHLLAETFCQASGARMRHVPFRGPSEAVTALMGQQVTAMFATASVATTLVESGKLRALAVTSPERMAALPSVPTLAEAGMQGMELREWEGMVAPAGTPKAIVEQWNRDLFRVMGSADVRARLAQIGMTVAAPNSSEEFDALVRRELEHWGHFVKTKGLRPA